MYRSLRIEDFRAIRRMDLVELRPLNLFVGPNNAGKTSVLEAVCLHACGPNLSLFASHALYARGYSFRNAIDLGEGLKYLFRSSASLRIAIEATWAAEANPTAIKPPDWASSILGNPGGTAHFVYEMELTRNLTSPTQESLDPTKAGRW